MDRVQDLRQQLKDAFKAFHDLQETKWKFFQDIHKAVMDILLKQLSESFRMSLEDYFELRNQHLHTTLKNMDECLNQASAAHTDTADYRTQLLLACNTNIHPPFTASEDPVLLCGQGMKDLHSVSSEAEQCLLHVSELQEQASSLMDTVEEKVPHMMDAALKKAMTEMKQGDERRLLEVEEVMQRGNEELGKAVQVLESMEKVQQQIECLCLILRKPVN